MGGMRLCYIFRHVYMFIFLCPFHPKASHFELESQQSFDLVLVSMSQAC